MFRFMSAPDTPQAVFGKQVMRPMLDWNLPAALGGPRRWSLSDRDLVYGEDTYAPSNDIVAWELPLVGQIPTNAEEWSFIVADPRGEWERRLVSHYKGTLIRLWMARELDGIVSINRMHLATGWTRRVVPVEDDEGRRMEVHAANELWSLDRDVALPMTPNAERDLDESADSLAYTERAATLEWGGRQGTRRDG